MTTGSIARTSSVGIGAHAGTLLSALAVLAFGVLLVVPGTTQGGPQMDEGAVLAYADRVLEGAVPHRDFLSFYGPGNVWVVAGAFKVFGSSLATERAVGLLYQVLIMFSVFALARRVAGIGGGLAAGIVSALILNGSPVWAYATFGALAAGLGGLALATVAAASSSARRQELLLLGAGASAGVAVLMRFDFAPAILLSALPLFLFVGSRGRVWYAAGFVAVASLYVPHLALVGPEKIERVARDLIASGPGRTLPVPALTEYPGSVLASAVIVTGVLVVAGAVVTRRRRTDLVGRVLLAVGLLNAALLPWAFSRPDTVHIEPVAIVPLSLAPAVVLWLARPVRPYARLAVVVAQLVLTATLVAGDGGFLVQRIQSPTVENAGRTFPIEDTQGAKDLQAVVGRLEHDARPGESLFVGPRDLRRSNYGPSFIYFLIPKLEPASYYMELSPSTANRDGSGLADELRATDWLILTSEFDDQHEPNASDRLGPTEPNEVVRDVFCTRFEAGAYRLYERCGRRGGA